MSPEATAYTRYTAVDDIQYISYGVVGNDASSL